MSDPDTDQWEQVGQTLDWVAALLATHARLEPHELVWPAMAVGLFTGLGAEVVKVVTGGSVALMLVGVTLTVCGFGMLGLLAHRFRRSGGASGGARSADAEIMAPWLRRLQVLLAAVLVGVVVLALLGAVTGSLLLIARNSFEVGRVASVVLALSWLLMDDEVGLPDWLAARDPAPAPAQG